MSKLYNDIRRMLAQINIINQYNNFRQLNMEEDILFLKNKINDLYKITILEQLVEEFKWCSNMVNELYGQIDTEYKKSVLEEEKNQD